MGHVQRFTSTSFLAFVALSAGWLACSSDPTTGTWATLSPGSYGDAGAAADGDPSSNPDSPDGEVGEVDPDGGDPAEAAVTEVDSGPQIVACTSGTYWTGGDSKSALMHPGAACRSCHVVGGAGGVYSLDVAGTVYKTAHEPIDCNGTSVTGANVVITDANGASTSLPINAAGNFSHSDLLGFAPLVKPLTVKVVNGGSERAMVGTVSDGDCNKCHTVHGTSLAPGRIMLP